MTKIVDSARRLLAVEVVGDDTFVPVGIVNGAEESVAISISELALLIGDRSYIIEGSTKASVKGGTSGYLDLRVNNVEVLKFTSDTFVPSANNSYSFGTSSNKVKDINMSGAINLGLDATGDIYYRENNILKRLAIGATDQILSVNNGLPIWKTITIPNPDLSNYVIKDGTSETITSFKTFSNVTGIEIKRPDHNTKALRISSNADSCDFVGTLIMPSLTANHLWGLPDKTGTLVVESDLLWSSFTYNSANYVKRSGRVLIGDITNPSYSDAVLGLRAITGATSSTGLYMFEKDYNYFLFRVGNDGDVVAGKNITIGGANTIASRTYAAPYIKFIYPSANNKYISFYLYNEPAANVNFFIPTADGTSGQVLTTNGAGQLSWTTVSGGGSYSVFTNTVNGLVPAPNISDGTTKVLSHNGTTHSWITLSTGVTTRLRLNTGTYRTGDLTLQSLTDNGVVITEPSNGVFQIVHADTSSASNITTSNFTIVGSLSFDDYGHVVSASSRNLLPGTSNGYFLRDDGAWVAVSGGGGGTGTVTSVGLSVPTGFSVANSPITTSGTLTLSFASGYSLPTTAKQTNWDTAYNWGNHALAGYLTSESDPYGVSSITVSGTNTKTITITLRNSTTKSATFTDLIGEAGSGDGYVSNVTFNNSNGNLSFTGVGNAFGSSVSLDGRYLNILEAVGSSKYYGTDNNGTRGYYDLPSSSSTYGWNISAIGSTTPVVNNGTVIFIGTNGIDISKADAVGECEIGINLNASLDDLNNVNTSGVNTNYVLRYNGTSWVASIDTALSWGNHAGLYVPLGRTITINGTTYDLSANRSWSVGTITSVSGGNGIKSTGGNTPSIFIESVAGTSGSIGTVIANSDGTLGVALGTSGTVAAPGNHTHAPDRHAITDTAYHTAGAWKVFYSDSDSINELTLGNNDTILTSAGSSSNPTFKSFYSFNIFNSTNRGLVPPTDGYSETEETRFLRADGTWSVPNGTGIGMANPMTTLGDIIYGSTGGAPTRLPATTNGYVLTLAGGIPSWAAPGSYTHGNHIGDVLSSGMTTSMNVNFISTKASDSIAGSDYLIASKGATSLYKTTFSLLKSYVLNYNSTSVTKVLISANNAASWFDYNITSIPAGGTSGYVARTNGNYIEYYQLGTLTAGNGLTTNSYNTTSSVTFAIDFNAVAAKTHSHTFTDLPNITAKRILGRNSDTAGIIEELTVNTTSTESNLQFIGTVLSGRLFNETTPKLNGALDANSNNITSVGHITPIYPGSATKNLGSTSAYWNNLYAKGYLYIGGTTYYAGDANGSAKFNIVNATTVIGTTIKSTLLQIGTNYFLKQVGSELHICYGSELSYTVVAKITASGNGIYFVQ